MSTKETYLESLQVETKPNLAWGDELAYFLSNPFEWDTRRALAVELLAEGWTLQEVADKIGVCQKTVWRWTLHDEFKAEKHKLAFLSGVAVKAERLIMIKQLIRDRLREDGVLDSKKDVLDWIRLLREEVGDMELAALLAGLLGEQGADSS